MELISPLLSVTSYFHARFSLQFTPLPTQQAVTHCSCRSASKGVTQDLAMLMYIPVYWNMTHNWSKNIYKCMWNEEAFLFFGAFAKLRKVTNSFVMSVRPLPWNNTAPSRRIFMKLDIWVFFDNMSPKFDFPWNRTRITGSLHDDQYTYLIVSRSVIFRVRNVSVKFYTEIPKINFYVQ